MRKADGKIDPAAAAMLAYVKMTLRQRTILNCNKVFSGLQSEELHRSARIRPNGEKVRSVMSGLVAVWRSRAMPQMYLDAGA